MGIYPHAASHYHVPPKVKRGIVILSVDQFMYPGKQTKGNEFIPRSNDVCHILKHPHNFKTPAIPFIWSKSSYEFSVTQLHRSGKESGRRPWSQLWRHQWCSFLFISHVDVVKYEICIYTSWLLANHDIAHSTNMPNVKLENFNSWKDPISPTHRKTMGVFHEQIGVRWYVEIVLYQSHNTRHIHSPKLDYHTDSRLSSC